MATQRQIEANRRNALKSTGPRTAAGKARSARNSLVHGFAARTFKLDPQGSPAFLELRDHWLAQYPRADAEQRDTLEQIAVTIWHLGRLAEFEAEEYQRQAAAAEAVQRQRIQRLLDLDANELNQLRRSGQTVTQQLVVEQLKSDVETPLVGLPPDRLGRYEGSLERTLHRLFRKLSRSQRGTREDGKQFKARSKPSRGGRRGNEDI